MIPELLKHSFLDLNLGVRCIIRLTSMLGRKLFFEAIIFYDLVRFLEYFFGIGHKQRIFEIYLIYLITYFIFWSSNKHINDHSFSVVFSVFSDG